MQKSWLLSSMWNKKLFYYVQRLQKLIYLLLSWFLTIWLQQYKRKLHIPARVRVEPIDPIVAWRKSSEI